MEVPSAMIGKVLSIEANTIDDNSGMLMNQPNMTFKTQIIPET